MSAQSAKLTTLSAGLKRKAIRKRVISASPNHLELGKRTPAERSGEAHPMIPSGGIAASTMHSGTQNAALPRPRENSKPQGNANRIEAAKQRDNPMIGVPCTPKKARAPGMSGQLAPA